jgi:hypothetical protein
MERRLTEAVIPALRTTKAQEEVYHSATPSAGIRVTRDGAKTFFIRYHSPTHMGKDPNKPALRRFYFGEHRSLFVALRVGDNLSQLARLSLVGDPSCREGRAWRQS